MTSFNFRSLLWRAARLTVSVRGLLVFGFITAVIGGGGELDFVLRNYDRLLNFLFEVATNGLAVIQALIIILGKGIANAFTYNLLPSILALVVGVVVTLVISWLLFTAQAVLIEIPALIEQKKRFTFRTAIQHASSNYWSFLGLAILRTLAAWLPFIILASLGAAIWPSVVDRIGYFLFFLIFVPLAFITGFLSKFVVAGLIINDLPFWLAVTQALRLFSRAWLATIEFAVLVLVAGLLLFTAASFVAIIILVPFLLLSGILAAYLSLTAAVLVKTAGVAIFFLLLLATGLFFATFEHVSWSLFYLAANEGGVESKLVRLFRRT